LDARVIGKFLGYPLDRLRRLVMFMLREKSHGAHQLRFETRRIESERPLGSGDAGIPLREIVPRAGEFQPAIYGIRDHRDDTF